MTSLQPSTASRVTAGDDTPRPGRDPALPGVDGVMGDVLVTVALAAALAALVAGVLFVLWRALPGASAVVGVIGSG